MNSRSLARLAALTQGAALVGAGVLACGGGSSSPAADPSNTPASSFTLTTLPTVDSGAADVSTTLDASVATPSADAVPTNIVDAGPGTMTTGDPVDAEVDGGHRRHRFPSPNAIPRRHFDGGIAP